MRARPLGPLVRLASIERGSNAPSSFERKDWNAGRDLTEEESRAGILYKRKQLNITGVTEQEKGIKAVFKALSADFQYHEVANNDKDDFTLLASKPKGRWKKISRSKTILLENTKEPFSTPDKSFSPVTQSHGEYIKLNGKLPQDRPFLRFVCYRDNHSIKDVFHRLRYEANVPKEALVLHETPGGSFGCATQSGYCIGVTREQLCHGSRHYNIHPLIFDPRDYMDQTTFLTASQTRPSVCRYDLILRCLATDKNEVYGQLKSLKNDGYINYFGIDSFGPSSASLLDIAALHHKQRFDRSVGAYLQLVAEKDPFHFNYFMRYINSEPSALVGAAENWKEFCVSSKGDASLIRVLKELHAFHRSESTLEKVSLAIPVHFASEKSGAEFLWNVFVSQRVLQNPKEVILGDFVQEGNGNVKRVESESERRQYTIYDLVVPVPYAGGAGDFFEAMDSKCEAQWKTIAERYSLMFLFNGAKTEAGIFRKVFERPLTLTAELVEDPFSSMVLKTDLSLLQERKESNLPFPARIRYPSIHNVSERHLEKMNYVSRTHGGHQSLYLGLTLPNNSNPISALREVFSLRYMHFSDMITIN